MKSLKRLIPASVAVLMMLSTMTAHAASYRVLYSHLDGVQCDVDTDPGSLPYFAYFAVVMDEYYPAGAKIHAISMVNSTITADTWTTMPTAFIGAPFMDRVDSTVVNYTAKKILELWVDGTIRSRTEIEGTCSKAMLGEVVWPYPSAEIIEADIY